MTTHETYSSPLAERYASAAMLSLWSPQTRYGLWRRLWLALAECEQALGVDISAAAISEMRASGLSNSRLAQSIRQRLT